jgi:hypothetical protein
MQQKTIVICVKWFWNDDFISRIHGATKSKASDPPVVIISSTLMGNP